MHDNKLLIMFVSGARADHKTGHLRQCSTRHYNDELGSETLWKGFSKLYQPVYNKQECCLHNVFAASIICWVGLNTNGNIPKISIAEANFNRG